MGVPGNANTLLLRTAAAAGGYQISRSLRFSSGDSSYLSRTPSAGNRKTYTWSGWVKRSALGTTQNLFSTGTGANASMYLYFNSDNYLQYWDRRSSADNLILRTNAVFRDVSAWYHVVLSVNYSASTSTDRAKLFVNGLEQSYAIASYPNTTEDSYVNAAVAHYISDSSGYINGYLADIWFLDGIAATPSDFAETDATTGQWIPKAYTGSKGTNGFHLEFADNSAATAAALGKDTSGNSNNWTPNNLSVTAGAGNDSLVDTPTSYGTGNSGGDVRGNFCTWNPLETTGGTLANGNLDYSHSSASFVSVKSTISMASGKWYAEFNINGTSIYPLFGVIKTASALPAAGAFGYIGYTADSWACQPSGADKYNNNVSSNIGSSVTSGVAMIAVDVDAGKVWFGANGTWFSSGDPAAGTNAAYTGVTGPLSFAASMYSASAGYSANFGQRQWAYAAPAGFKALCDTNLTAPVIAKSNTVFDIKLYTGNGSTQTVSGLGFSPDLAWIKSRSSAYDNILFDTVRTATKQLIANSTGAEATYASSLTAFNSDGFSVGSDAVINNNASTYVAWCWDAGTSTVTNTQGSISSSVRANASAGFSIVTYTGNGTSGATVGHGLNVAPGFVIIKSRNQSGQYWHVWHQSFSAGEYIYLNTTGAKTSGADFMNNTLPGSSVFTLGNGAACNQNGGTHVAYAFSPVTGYSFVSSYLGSGSADGPFVYTGFRPRWLLIKCSSSDQAGNGGWRLFDTARSEYNVIGPSLYPNESIAEVNSTWLDVTSNGFKIRTTSTSLNASGATYIYCSFAESPFQYARAR